MDEAGWRRLGWGALWGAAWACGLAPLALAAPLPPPRPAQAIDAAPALVPPPPLPPSRPPEQGPPAPPLTRPAAPAEAARPEVTPVDEMTCAKLLVAGTVVARAVAPVGGPGGCGIAAPVEVSAVIVAAGRRVTLTPPVQVRCELAGAVAAWVKDDLVPLFEQAGTPLTGLVSTSGYACRGRNRVVGAKISEHGFGDALDIGGFAAAGRPALGVKDPSTMLADVKRTACARFTTVLGPGSDGYHEEHMHVDLAQRRNGYRICQWLLP